MKPLTERAAEYIVVIWLVVWTTATDASSAHVITYGLHLLLLLLLHVADGGYGLGWLRTFSWCSHGSTTCNMLIGKRRYSLFLRCSRQRRSSVPLILSVHSGKRPPRYQAFVGLYRIFCIRNVVEICNSVFRAAVQLIELDLIGSSCNRKWDQMLTPKKSLHRRE